jgi:hypothetical protein
MRFPNSSGILSEWDSIKLIAMGPATRNVLVLLRKLVRGPLGTFGIGVGSTTEYTNFGRGRSARASRRRIGRCGRSGRPSRSCNTVRGSGAARGRLCARRGGRVLLGSRRGLGIGVGFALLGDTAAPPPLGPPPLPPLGPFGGGCGLGPLRRRLGGCNLLDLRFIPRGRCNPPGRTLWQILLRDLPFLGNLAGCRGGFVTKFLRTLFKHFVLRGLGCGLLLVKGPSIAQQLGEAARASCS